MKLLKIIFLSSVIFFLYYFIFPLKTYGNSLYFAEEFDESPLDPIKWEVNQNAGLILPGNGKYRLSSFGNSFPYVYTQSEIFPSTKGFIVYIKFKYNSIGCWGTGIHITDLIPSNATQLIPGHSLGNVWLDCVYPLRIESSICSENNPACGDGIRIYIGPNLDTSEHILKIVYRYSTHKFKVYLNDEIKFTSIETDFIPKYIWIGHPQLMDHSDEWTSFEIDYIHVHSLPENPIIFLPGMMGCWNNSIITGGEGDNWSLWDLAYNTTYKPLLQNFQKAHLVENQDYYVFCYDWRKPIEHNKQKLSDFIQNNLSPPEKVDLVGHSMGGLVARSFAQANPEKVNKLITIGSPHEGAAQSYFAWEGGVILDDDPLRKFLKELLIFLNSPLEQVPLRTIRNKIPSIKDLLPTKSFLANKNNPSDLKPISSHKQQNDYFMNLNSTLKDSLVKEKISTIYGIGSMTLNKIKVTSFQPTTNWMHFALGMWEDGEPLSNNDDYSPCFINNDGDGTITVSSATIENVDENYQIAGDHLQIIKGDDGMQKIFSLLGLVFPNESASTATINKILALVLHSPANFWLTDQSGQQVGHQVIDNFIPNSFYDETVKTIVLLNPPDSLTLTVQGENSASANNPYEISFFELNDQNETTTYRFSNLIDGNQTKQFPLDSLKKSIFVNQDNHQSVSDSLINKINQAKNLVNKCSLSPSQITKIKKPLDQALLQIQKYQDKYDKQNFKEAARHLLNAWKKLFKTRNLINKFGQDSACALTPNEHILSTFPELEYLYLDTHEKQNYHPSLRLARLKLRTTKIILNRKNQKMQKLKNRGHDIYQYQGIAFTKAQDYYLKTEQALSENKNIKALLYSTISRLFLYEL